MRASRMAKLGHLEFIETAYVPNGAGTMNGSGGNFAEIFRNPHHPRANVCCVLCAN